MVCGIAHATLVIEAAPKSGSLITARLASDYNRELLVVPGSIFSENSKGTHQFLKLGATPVTEPDDILEVLGCDTNTFDQTLTTTSLDPLEQRVLALLTEPLARDELIRELALPISEAASLLMQMELRGLIHQSGHNYYKDLSS